MLHVCSSRHWRVFVFPREPFERLAHVFEEPLDDTKPGLHLQDGRDVHDILSRGAPVHILACIGAAEGNKLRDEGEDGVADDFGIAAELVEVDVGVGEFRGDCGADFGGDHFAVGLSAGESCFGVDAAGYVGFVFEDL